MTRPAEETERIYGPEEHRVWMTGLRCVICRRSPCHQAHVKSGGTSRKADACFTIPLCQKHHDEMDGRLVAGGKRTFAEKYKLDLLELAAKYWQRWLEHIATSKVVWDEDLDF